MIEDILTEEFRLSDDARTSIVPPLSVYEPSTESPVVHEAQNHVALLGKEAQMRVLWKVIH